MVQNIKRLAVIISVSILFAFFCFALSDVAFTEPDYADYCRSPPAPRKINTDLQSCGEVIVPEDFSRGCYSDEGMIRYEYDDEGCESGYYCDYCSRDYQDAEHAYGQKSFLLISLLGIIAIIAGLSIDLSDEAAGWTLSGLLLGGILSLIVSTAVYYETLEKVLRPFVLVIEIAIITFVAVKTSSTNKGKKAIKDKKR